MKMMKNSIPPMTTADRRTNFNDEFQVFSDTFDSVAQLAQSIQVGNLYGADMCVSIRFNKPACIITAPWCGWKMETIPSMAGNRGSPLTKPGSTT
ncbi:hypothetical protein ES319_D05G217600v1 [Gossypium barbadense]|uniref:Uncharacterized protein n=1 Tax=Gossypium barbadense TaxID=3634 RepID=A0A5J5RFF4_GOSBA|nr:hypothetical protein ES319_D05G217600v1 [Gossypium barbadense]